MLLHGEIKWLVAYLVLVAGAVVVGTLVGWPLWALVTAGIAGISVTFFGWLWQVGRYG